jgi:hypothetical protein
VDLGVQAYPQVAFLAEREKGRLERPDLEYCTLQACLLPRDKKPFLSRLPLESWEHLNIWRKIPNFTTEIIPCKPDTSATEPTLSTTHWDWNWSRSA